MLQVSHFAATPPSYSVSEMGLKKSMIRFLCSHHDTDVLHSSNHIQSCAEFTAGCIDVFCPREFVFQCYSKLFCVRDFSSSGSLPMFYLCLLSMSCLVLHSLLLPGHYQGSIVGIAIFKAIQSSLFLGVQPLICQAVVLWHQHTLVFLLYSCM